MLDLLRFFTPLLHPIGMVWFGCVVAAGVFAWKRKKASAISLGVVALVISLLGSPLPGALLAGLERPYARESVDDVPVCDAVVLLGGGHNPSKHDPAGFNITEAGDRILTALELMRRGRAATLIVGGGPYEKDGEKVSDADFVKEWISRWGLLTNEVVTVGLTTNTREEAVKLKALSEERQWKRLILVTSAFHMKRTEAVFRTAGLDVVPVACDFNTVGRPKSRSFNPFPRPEGFEALNLYIHEVVGMLVYRMKGWIKPAEAAPAD